MVMMGVGNQEARGGYEAWGLRPVWESALCDAVYYAAPITNTGSHGCGCG